MYLVVYFCWTQGCRQHYWAYVFEVVFPRLKNCHQVSRLYHRLSHQVSCLSFSRLVIYIWNRMIFRAILDEHWKIACFKTDLTFTEIYKKLLFCVRHLLFYFLLLLLGYSKADVLKGTKNGKRVEKITGEFALIDWLYLHV